MAERRLIYESEHVLVFLQDLGSEVFFVTFNEMGFRPRGDRFWGDSFLESLGYAAVGVVSKRTNFYPPDDAAKYLPRIREAARGRPTFTYGYSHGGYGALKYAKALSAKATIGLSPLWSMQPEDINGIDPLGYGYYDPKLRGGDRITAADIGPHNYIFFDRAHHPDGFHGGSIARIPGVTTIVTPFADHDSVRLITEGRIARPLLTSIVERPDLGRRALRAAIREARRRSFTYMHHRTRRLIRRAVERPPARRDLRLLSQVAEGAPEGGDKQLLLTLVSCLAEARSAAEARLAEISEEALATADLPYYWRLFRTLGFESGETRLANAMASAAAHAAHMHLPLVEMLFQLGRTEEAATHLEIAAQAPGIEEQAAQFTLYAMQVGRPDIAEQMNDRLDQAAHVAWADKVRIAFDAYHLYLAFGDRSRAFRRLRALEILCGDDERLQGEIANQLVAIGEFTHAGHIRAEIARRRPGDVVERMRALEAFVVSDPERTMTEVESLARRRDLPAAAWASIANMYEWRSERHEALKAMRNALRLEPRNPAYVHGLARLLWLGRDRGRTVAELKRAAQLEIRDVAVLQSLGQLAREANEPQLYLDFAERQLALAKQSWTAIAYAISANAVNNRTERTEALANQVLAHLAKVPDFPESEWARLTSEWFDLRLTRPAARAHQMATARFPDNHTLKRLRGSLELLNKMAAGKPEPPRRERGWFRKSA